MTTTVGPTVTTTDLEPPPPSARSQGRGIPARVRIMGWLILLMAVSLLSIGVVSRNLLLRQVDSAVNTALGQEAQEFPSTSVPCAGWATRWTDDGPRACAADRRRRR